MTVTADLLERLGLSTGEAERLVRRSFDFLLEREPASSILSTFSLGVISRYFPDYEETLRARMG